MKGKVYRVVVRPAMMYGIEVLAIGRRQEAELGVAELKMQIFSFAVATPEKGQAKWKRT